MAMKSKWQEWRDLDLQPLGLVLIPMLGLAIYTLGVVVGWWN